MGAPGDVRQSWKRRVDKCPRCVYNVSLSRHSAGCEGLLSLLLGAVAFVAAGAYRFLRPVRCYSFPYLFPNKEPAS
jgi:hypothetical protein